MANPKPARIPPQTPPAGGTEAEAGQIPNPRKIVCPAESALFPFHSWGFSAKWVLTFSNKHHNSEFEERLASPAPSARATGGIPAKNCQGILKSEESTPAARRRFEPMETRKSLIPERFSCPYLMDRKLCICYHFIQRQK